MTIFDIKIHLNYSFALYSNFISIIENKTTRGIIKFNEKEQLLKIIILIKNN